MRLFGATCALLAAVLSLPLEHFAGLPTFALALIGRSLVVPGAFAVFCLIVLRDRGLMAWSMVALGAVGNAAAALAMIAVVWFPDALRGFGRPPWDVESDRAGPLVDLAAAAVGVNHWVVAPLTVLVVSLLAWRVPHVPKRLSRLGVLAGGGAIAFDALPQVVPSSTLGSMLAQAVSGIGMLCLWILIPAWYLVLGLALRDP